MFELMGDRNIGIAFRGGMAKLGQAMKEGLIYQRVLWSSIHWDNLTTSSSLKQPTYMSTITTKSWTEACGAVTRLLEQNHRQCHNYTNSPLCTASQVICFQHWRCTASSWRSRRCDPGLFHINSLFCVCLLSFKFVKYHAKVMQHMLSISNITSRGPFFRETIKERDSL